MVVKYKNNWIPTKTIEEMVQTNYDVLIVGSGPGGGARMVYALGGRSLFWNAATPRPIRSALNKGNPYTSFACSISNTYWETLLLFITNDFRQKIPTSQCL